MEISRRLARDNPVYVPNRKRKEIGNIQDVNFPKGRITCQENDLSVNDIDLLSSTLNNQGELTNFGQGPAISQRETNQIYLKGFRIEWSFINTSTEDVFWHMAIVHPKDNSRPIVTDLLRQYDSGRSKTLDGTCSGVDGLKGLNTDKYDVLWHSKWKVGGLIDTTTQLRRVNAPMSTCEDVNYIPVNRWISYADEDGLSCNDKMFLIMWCISLNRVPGEALSQLVGATQLKCFTLWEDEM